MYSISWRKRKHTGHYCHSLFCYNFHVNWLSNFICNEQNKNKTGKSNWRLSGRTLNAYSLTQKREYRMRWQIFIRRHKTFAYIISVIILFHFIPFLARYLTNRRKCCQAAIALTSATWEKIQTYWHLQTCRSESFHRTCLPGLMNPDRKKKTCFRLEYYYQQHICKTITLEIILFP